MANSVDIFFSYPGGSPADSQHVLRLGELLEQYGLRSWIAERDRPQLDDYPDDNPIIGALDSASVVIACFGQRPAGRWRLNELHRAAERAVNEPNFLYIGVILPGADTPFEEGFPEALKPADMFDFGAGVTSAAPLIPLLWSRLQPEWARLLAEVVSACRHGAVALVGPVGSGKSALAEVAASELAANYPDGQAQLMFEARRGTGGMASLIMRTLRIDVQKMPQSSLVSIYKERLKGRRYLVVLDEVDLDRATELIPPAPSTAIFISQRRPKNARPYQVFNLRARALGGRRHRDSEVPTFDTQPGYASDVPDGADLLSIQSSVNALCSLIAAREVRPPLSIGLFGDWGAGKSFFLAKMRARVRSLADASANANGDSAYASSVKQIVFNAWHYADANLWASLASRIFEGLREGDDGAIKDLIAELESSRLQLATATTSQAAASSRRRQAEDDADAARQKVSRTEVELSDVSSSARDILIESGKADEAVLLSLAGSARELWNRSKTLALSVVAVLAICVVVELAAPGVYAWLAAVVAVVAGLLAMVCWPVRLVLQARERAERRADDLRRRREAELAAKVEALRRDERDAINRREEARRSVEDAELVIEEIEDGRRLYRFIEERARGEAYRKYLGLMSIVRRDFEQLAELIDNHEVGRPRLERIVLYVDDLDRCPAPRVVEVLEAVHLLLASELFVVVVAVDPRWLVRSLEHHYAAEMPGMRNGGGSAMPQDFLEKIFQIPFSLPPMSADGYQRLVESLIDTEGVESRELTADDRSNPVTSPRALSGDPGNPIPPSDLTVASTEVLPPRNIDLMPEGLRVTPAELEYLCRLNLMVVTPRAAKRMTNLYRLVRVSLSEDQLALLLGSEGDPAEYPCVQLLLAITVGFPSLAPRFFDELALRGKGRWWSFLDSREPPPSDARAWKRLLAAVGPLRDSRFPDASASVARWVPHVSQFSYGLRPLDSE